MRKKHYGPGIFPTLSKGTAWTAYSDPCSCRTEDSTEPFPTRALLGDTSSGPFRPFLHPLRGCSRQTAQTGLTGGAMRPVYCSPVFLLAELLWQTQPEFAGNTRVTKPPTPSLDVTLL